MEHRSVRARCEARLRELELPDPFDAAAFCALLAARRGRPIVLQPFRSRAGPCGLWVATPSADVVLYEQDTSPLHRQHIILHEASHIVCGHRPLLLPPSELASLLLPDLHPDWVGRVLRRAVYSREEEREAEVLASLILERAAPAPPSAAPPPDAPTARTLARLEATLEGPREGTHP
jgi:hypothetical protein